MRVVKAACGVCVLALGLESNAWAQAASTPNVLIIIADDLGADKLDGFAWNSGGSEPNFPVHTDNLDRLRSTGLTFTQAWANPVCSATRASLHTGNYAYKNNIGNVLPQAPELKDVPYLLPEAALMLPAGARQFKQTALFGKWHLGVKGTPPGNIWFGSAEASYSPGTQTPYPPPLKRGLSATHQAYNWYSGFLGGDVGDATSWERVYQSGSTWYVHLETDSYPDEQAVFDAYTWINGLSALNKPWLAVVALAAPHSEGETPHYTEEEVLADDPDPTIGDPGVHGGDCDALADTDYDCLYDSTDCSQALLYRALVECMDERVGEFLVDLGSINALDSTIIIFIGDNGTPAGDTSTSDTIMEGNYLVDEDTYHEIGKGTVYQSGVRVPMIISDGDWYDSLIKATETDLTMGTRVKYHHDVTALVQTFDVYDTVLQAAGYTPSGSTATDSVPLNACFNSNFKTCADTAVGLRPQYAEHYVRSGPTYTTGLTEGAASVRTGNCYSTGTAGINCLKMVATYDGTAATPCMDWQYFYVGVSMMSGRAPDPNELSPLTPTHDECKGLQDSFKTTSPSTLDPANPTTGWMPHDGSNNIVWCSACPT